VKEQFLVLAHLVFSNTFVNVTADGSPYLGAAIGSQSYVDDYVSEKCLPLSWVSELETLIGSVRSYSATLQLFLMVLIVIVFSLLEPFLM